MIGGRLLGRFVGRIRAGAADRRRRARLVIAAAWPQLWKEHPEPIAFILRASKITAAHRAFADLDEWVGTAVDPGVFAAHMVHVRMGVELRAGCPVCAWGARP